MLYLDEKRITKSLKRNNVIGKFKGKEITSPSHKTERGIRVYAFKLRFRDLLKIMFRRRLYIQQVPSGKNKDRIAISIALTETDCNKEVQANEDYLGLSVLNTKTGSES